MDYDYHDVAYLITGLCLRALKWCEHGSCDAAAPPRWQAEAQWFPVPLCGCSAAAAAHSGERGRSHAAAAAGERRCKFQSMLPQLMLLQLMLLHIVFVTTLLSYTSVQQVESQAVQAVVAVHTSGVQPRLKQRLRAKSRYACLWAAAGRGGSSRRHKEQDRTEAEGEAGVKVFSGGSEVFTLQLQRTCRWRRLGTVRCTHPGCCSSNCRGSSGCRCRCSGCSGSGQSGGSRRGSACGVAAHPAVVAVSHHTGAATVTLLGLAHAMCSHPHGIGAGFRQQWKHCCVYMQPLAYLFPGRLAYAG